MSMEGTQGSWEVESTFFRNNKKYLILKTREAIRRNYRLNIGRMQSWYSYSGAHGCTGPAIRAPVAFTKRGEEGKNFLFSNGPWWLDANHSAPGYGNLNLIFYTALNPNCQTNQDVLVDEQLLLPTMRNMTIRGRLRGGGVQLKGADLVLWFQCYSEEIKRFVNYALVGQPLNDHLLSGQCSTFQLDVDITKTDDWVCLGSSKEREDIYGTLPLEALNVDKVINFGFILIPIKVETLWADEVMPLSYDDLGIPSEWPIDLSCLPSGCIALYDLEIDYESHYRLTCAEG